MLGPKGAHICGFYRPCICPILVCKTGRSLFQSPYGVYTGPHCIRRDTFRNSWGTSTGSCYTGAKTAKTYSENRENACDNCIAGGRFRPYHTLPWLPKPHEPGHTRWSHACELSIIYLMPHHMKLSDSVCAPLGPSLSKHKENDTACIASPHDVSKKF